jgi:hypothetical protein
MVKKTKTPKNIIKPNFRFFWFNFPKQFAEGKSQSEFKYSWRRFGVIFFPKFLFCV